MALFIYLIRNGQFAEDYGFKLILTLVALLICILFAIFTKKYDYLIVFFTGIIIWSSFELMVTGLAIRSIIDASFFNMDLHWSLACILRGSSEGAVVAIVGVIFGDYIPKKKTMKFALPAGILLISYFVFRTLTNGLMTRDVGGDISSRRDVFAWPSIVFFVVLTVFNITWFILQKDSELRKRALSMFITVLAFATIWAIAQYFANTRWIETSTGVGFNEASTLVTILIFVWDLIIEVAMCYVAFLTIPQTIKHLIQKSKGEKISTTVPEKEGQEKDV